MKFSFLILTTLAFGNLKLIFFFKKTAQTKMLSMIDFSINFK